MVVGPDGALYFTDPTMDFVAGAKQELPFQGVYRLDAKGNLKLLTKDLAQPNGLAFSPDGRHFYVDDSEKETFSCTTSLPTEPSPTAMSSAKSRAERRWRT